MLLDAPIPRCSGGIGPDACGKLATVLCTKETAVVGAPVITWFACDAPEHQKGGTVRALTKRWPAA
jgi:hypothetical protein